MADAVGHAHISTTLGYDRRRKKRRTGVFRAVSGLVADDHGDDEHHQAPEETRAQRAARLAKLDAEQLPRQTTVPMPGYDDQHGYQ